MIARGRVKNGVVVFDDGVHLPEGQEVTVLTSNEAEAPLAGSSSHGLLDIPVVSVGAILHPLASGDDLLGEMLESRL